MSDAIASLGSVRARGIALLIVVAIAAGVAGGAVDRWWMQRSMTPAGGAALAAALGEGRRERGFVVARGQGADEGIPLSLRAVTLSADQTARIRAITARYRPAAESLMLNVRPRVLALDFQMRQEAMCVLTPAQRADWIAWRKREGLAVEEGNEMLKLVNSGRCPPETHPGK